MLVDFFKQYKKGIIGVSIIGTVLLAAGIIYFSVFLFHVTNVTPDPNGASYLTPQLTVSFNKAIVPDGLEVKSDTIKIKTSIVDNKLIITFLADLKANQTYPITITSVHSKNGDKIQNYLMTVKPDNNEKSMTSEDYKKVLQTQQESKSKVLNDPIFNHVPHSTLDYSIDSEISNADTDAESITLVVTINLSAADVRIDRSGAVNLYQKEATDYLASFPDININNYNVQFSIIDPTL